MRLVRTANDARGKARVVSDEDAGAMLNVEAPRTGEAIVTATFDLDALRAYRTSWGVFRDRRPEMYGPLMTLDGQQ